MKNNAENINNSRVIVDDLNNPYFYFKDALDRSPFIIIIGKYDHVLGPRSLYSSVPLKNENFIRNLLRDALNTKNRFVILDFNKFYSQIYKIDVDDPAARGGKQLYAIIILRDVEYPLIPILHLKRIGIIFNKIENESILADDVTVFKKFFEDVSDIYIKKVEVLPLESVNIQIRNGITTIQGFCELIQEQIKNNSPLSDQDILDYMEMMLDSCKDIIIALERPKNSTSK